MPRLKYLLQQNFEQSSAPRGLAPDPATLERFLAACRRRRYPAKATLILPGDPVNTLYYVIDGSAAVCIEDQHGHELILAYIYPGQFIGETSLFVQHEVRQSIVRTRTACEIADIGYEQLLQLLQGPLQDDCPKLLYMMASQLAKRLMRTSRQASRMAFLDVIDRVSAALLELCDEPDANSHLDGTQVRISRQELSRLTGCSREMAGRALKQLEEQGMLDVNGKNIVVRDLPREPLAK